MVRGLERFRDSFAAHAHQYALIGGTACDLLLAQVDLPFRATKDLDIVLMSEMLDTSFAGTFWEFVRAGRYEVGDITSGCRIVVVNLLEPQDQPGEGCVRPRGKPLLLVGPCQFPWNC